VQGSAFFDSLSIWWIFVITLLLSMLSVEVGYRWARYKQVRVRREKEAPVGAMVAATLALLAFLLAFTYSMSVEALQARKQALVDEANAIQTTYLRACLIPEPQSTHVRKILRAYVEERLQWTGVENGQQNLSSKRMHCRLWMQAMAVGRGNPDSEVAALFIESVNNVIDIHTQRVVARQQSRIPGTFWIVTYVIAIIAHASIGYHGGVARTTRSPVTLAVAIAFTAVIVLNVDIDRPGEGWVNVNQRIMVDLRNWMSELKV